MAERAAPYVIGTGETRRDDALLPFKARAADTDGALSICESTLGPWDAGPVLHVHASVDEARGGLEDMFAEQAAYLASLQGPPDPEVLADIGARHGATTLGPPIRAGGAPVPG